MSDYLWDKTGEADDETKRLEELLGGLKFQPRPLELPALPARPLRAARTLSLPSWPRLAVAASLAAALLLGAWLLMIERRATTNNAPQLAGHNEQPGASVEPKHSQAVAPESGGGGGETKGVDKPATEDAPLKNAAARQRPRLPDMVKDARRALPRGARPQTADRAARPERVAPRPAAERREEVAQFTKEEREAAEKVLFALRLTSEKLSYARRQVQDAGRRDANR